ncbi:MAG: hypothetical protein OEZ58_20185 [Gammaproteobacteria bacterium]|nr:hypothetical protein [Gammaproteobacteria bacterium]MDH5731311.1 hypothetical protein [Gammaproteobacteria bacterium]
MRHRVFHLTLLFVLISPMGLHAQTNTLLGDEIKHIGVLGGPFLKLTSFGEQINYQAGAELVGFFNRQLILGINASSSVKKLPGTQYHLTNVNGVFGYQHRSNRLLYFASTLSAGLGAIVDNPLSKKFLDKFLVVEPQASLVINVIKHLKLSASLSYRFIDGLDQPTMSAFEASGFSISGQFHFGIF